MLVQTLANHIVSGPLNWKETKTEHPTGDEVDCIVARENQVGDDLIIYPGLYKFKGYWHKSLDNNYILDIEPDYFIEVDKEIATKLKTLFGKDDKE